MEVPLRGSIVVVAQGGYRRGEAGRGGRQAECYQEKGGGERERTTEGRRAFKTQIRSGPS